MRRVGQLLLGWVVVGGLALFVWGEVRSPTPVWSGLGANEDTARSSADTQARRGADRPGQAQDAEPYPPAERVLAKTVSGGWLNIDFLVTSEDPDSALAEARRCVRSRPGRAVACYGFASRKARRASNPVEAGNFKQAPCWMARYNRNKRGDESGDTSSPGAYSNCPGEPSGAGDTVRSPSDTIPADSLRVQIALEVEINDAGRARLMGRMNLPDGTVLSMSLSRNMFMAQGDGVVSDGRFTSPWFSSGGQALSPGEYEASVTVPFFNSQPDSVRAVLGERLMRMTGPLAEWSSPENPKLLGKVANKDTVVEIQ